MLATVQKRVVVSMSLMILLLLPGTIGLQSLKAESYADPAFRAVWERSDKAVAEGTAKDRSWLWGPGPNTAGLREPYVGANGGERLVQYYDKSRMEINNPAADRSKPWFVTNGLLTVELVTGRQQVGDTTFKDGQPSIVPVGGDPNNPGPSYASFARLIKDRAERKTGLVGESVDRSGQTGRTVSAEAAKLARYNYYADQTGHNLPDVFWNWLQKLPDDWLFVMGYPISEPYWAKFVVGGTERELLVQLFERRVLTYNPANPAAFQVEMGNIGQHYYAWRYPSAPPGQPTAPGPTNPGPGQPAPPTGNPGPTSLDPAVEEAKLVGLVNQYRRQNNLPELRADDKLGQAARWHSLDMAKYNYFGHIDSQGRDYPKRLRDFGYTATTVNENLAAGVDTEAAFEIWKKSPGYNAILLNPDYKAIGFGFAIQSGTTYNYYWTANFGGS